MSPSKSKKSKKSSPLPGGSQNPNFDLKHHPFPHVAPSVVFEGEKLWEPLGNVDLNGTGDIVFSINCPEHYLIHPAENPFVITYVIKKDATPLQVLELTDRTANKILAIHSAIGGGTFFDKCNVYVNDVPLSGLNDKIENRDFFYTTANRILSTHKDRVRLMGKDSVILSSKDWTGEKPAESKSARQDSEMSSLHFFGGVDCSPIMNCFGFDATPLAGARNLVLDKIRGASHNAIIRPGSTLKYRLTRSSKWQHKLLRVMSALFYDSSNEENTYKAAMVDYISTLKLEIKSIHVRTNMYVIKNQEKLTKQLSNANSRYDVDLVNFHTLNLLQGHNETTNDVVLDPGTKIALLTFVRDEVLWHDDTDFKVPKLPLFLMPTNILKLKISLDGSPPLFSEQGLKNCFKSDWASSPSCYSYYKQIYDKGYIDYTFDQIFSRQNVPFNHVLVIDLTNKVTTERPRLEIKCEWNNKASPKKISLLIMSVRDSTLTIDPNLHTYLS